MADGRGHAPRGPRQIDVLVNNAGYGSYGSLEEVDLAEGRRQFDVNVFGLARMTQLVLPAMRAAAQGRIINVSSIGGKMYEPLGAWYHATKFAVEGHERLAAAGTEAPRHQGVNHRTGRAPRRNGAPSAGESLLATSGHGPYRDQAKIVAAALASTGGAPARRRSPDVIADAIVHAATAARPKTRYPVGRGAWPS